MLVPVSPRLRRALFPKEKRLAVRKKKRKLFSQQAMAALTRRNGINEGQRGGSVYAVVP